MPIRFGDEPKIQGANRHTVQETIELSIRAQRSSKAAHDAGVEEEQRIQLSTPSSCHAAVAWWERLRAPPVRVTVTDGALKVTRNSRDASARGYVIWR